MKHSFLVNKRKRLNTISDTKPNSSLETNYFTAFAATKPRSDPANVAMQGLPVFAFRTELVKRDNKSRTRLFNMSKQTFPFQYFTFPKQPIINGFIDVKMKKHQAVLMRIEENSEHCCLKLNIMDFYNHTDSPDCTHRISCALSFPR